MIKRFLVLFMTIAILSNTATVKAGDDEGMWLPLLAQKLNMKKMKAMGLKLTAEDLYSINNGSLKDAVIALDHGSCTGELVSPDGLFLTNHHCGYGEIQAHSTVEHDYLTDGFWAMTREQELANPGKTVSFLIKVTDVTDQINEVLTDGMTEDERDAAIKKISTVLEEEAMKDNWYEAEVKPFFHGNQFFIFVYETFKDVRLVGAPPSSIGKFGADTDNWMWPRHTGDFSMFRIYCGPDGKPAEYSENNVPYHPKKFFPVSVKGVEKNDFAMVMGYPGGTTRYMTSFGVKQTIKNENTIRIKLRGLKQGIMKPAMDSDDAIRIKYASKYSRSMNYYKYSIGQNLGLDNLNVVGKKQNQEASLTKWINAKDKRKAKYGNALNLIESSITEADEYDIAINYWFEAFWGGAESVKFALNNSRALKGAIQKDDKAALEEIRKSGDDFFKDYYQPIDKGIFVIMMKTYKEDLDKTYYPEFFATVDSAYNGDFQKFADELYSTSIFVDKAKFNKFLDNPTIDVLDNDMALSIAQDAIAIYFSIKGKSEAQNSNLYKGKRLFEAAILEEGKKVAHYPDANSTMRLTYGTVGDYEPKDAVLFKHYTTLKGYMEKEDATNAEFFVHDKLKTLYKNQDFGQYGQAIANGESEMRVCFTTNNDITGGNSGSPVINGNGELIGIAFDGNWEAMSGDIAFEPELQKCINVDIRFVLFIIDKYAGAGHLIEEMTIVK